VAYRHTSGLGRFSGDCALRGVLVLGSLLVAVLGRMCCLWRVVCPSQDSVSRQSVLASEARQCMSSPVSTC
jgi:hypothetical protein